MTLFIVSCTKIDTYEELECPIFTCNESSYVRIVTEMEMYRVVISPTDIEVYGSQDKGVSWTNLEDLGFFDVPIEILENTQDTLKVKTKYDNIKIITKSGDGIYIDDSYYTKI